jgi:hypothetical protein
MVYEYIIIKVSRHVLLQTKVETDDWRPSVPGSLITFTRPRLPLDILGTCRLVNKEAKRNHFADTQRTSSMGMHHTRGRNRDCQHDQLTPNN